MRQIDMVTPHFTDRVAEAQRLVDSRDHTPDLPDADRALLSTTLRSLRRAVVERAGAEQLLHGEPHPGNLLRTKQGLLFVDLETACRGPVEFDIAHAPEAVSNHYQDADQQLVRQCRVLMLAMIWIAPLLAQDAGPGRPRTVDVREIANAIFYLDKTGCQWEMLPDDFPDYRHVNYYYLEWTRKGIWDQVLARVRELARVVAGKAPEPTAAVMDSQSVKTTGHGQARG
jgi:transposase